MSRKECPLYPPCKETYIKRRTGTFHTANLLREGEEALVPVLSIVLSDFPSFPPDLRLMSFRREWNRYAKPGYSFYPRATS